MTDEPEPHAVLGVSTTATPQEVHRAFQRLVRAHHPDLVGDDREDDARLRAILAAYAVLRRAGEGFPQAAGSVPSAANPIVPTSPSARSPAARSAVVRPWGPPEEPVIRAGPVRWHGPPTA